MRALGGGLLAGVRLLLVVAALLILVVTWILPALLRPLSPRVASRVQMNQLHAWGRVTTLILGVRVRVEGEPPRRPYFLVCNHLSWLDIMTLWSRLDCYFLAKSDLGRWPVVGALVRGAGTLFIDRERRAGVRPAIEEVRRKLEQGNGVLVFPEGTSSDGSGLLPFRSSLFQVPAAMGYPVHVACLHYATGHPRHSTRLRVAWWGDMEFPGHFLRLLTIPVIRARIRFAPEPVRGADRKQLAAASHAAMSALFEAIPDESP